MNLITKAIELIGRIFIIIAVLVIYAIYSLEHINLFNRWILVFFLFAWAFLPLLEMKLEIKHKRKRK